MDWKGQWDKPGQWGGMSNGCPTDVHWTGGWERTVGQAWLVRVGCPMDFSWTSTGQVGQSQVDRGFWRQIWTWVEWVEGITEFAPRKTQNLKSLLPGKFALQWMSQSTLAYLTTMGRDYGQISETAVYVNHQVSFGCASHCWCEWLHLGLHDTAKSGNLSSAEFIRHQHYPHIGTTNMFFFFDILIDLIELAFFAPESCMWMVWIN